MFLIAKAYRIVARRWKTPLGEIDIVARRRRSLVFVEVKARANADEAAEAVTERVKRRIIGAAEVWLARHPDDANRGNPLRRDPGRAGKDFRATSSMPSTPAPDRAAGAALTPR